MRSSDTGATVLDGLVGDGELAQVVTAHFRLQVRVESALDGLNDIKT